METLESSVIFPDDTEYSSDKAKAHIAPSRRLKPSPQTRITERQLIAHYLLQETTTEREAHGKLTTLDNLG